jgi:formate dehydrogenase subunit gamma
MRVQQDTGKPRNRLYIGLAAVAVALLLAMTLPLTGYVLHSAGLVQVAQAQEEEDEELVNQRAEYWRAVRGGVEGYSAVSGQETGVLIQSGGQDWRELRNDTVTLYGGWLIILSLVAIAAFHAIKGKDKLEARTGQTITRWSAFERFLHWFMAISFIVLAITGLSLIFGRALLIPLMGKEGFAAWAQLAKPVHDYLSLPFAAGLFLMLLMMMPRMFFNSRDFEWLGNLGGHFGGKHTESGFFNGGEKVFYWLLFFGGIALTVSGFYALFPNLGTERDSMQFWNIVHSASGVLLIAVALGHIYLGSIGTEGVLEGIVGGEVDESFARQHHKVWYDEVKGGAPAAEAAPTPDVTTAAPT